MLAALRAIGRWHLRQSILSEQGQRCCWCRRHITCREATLEHLLPVGRGGPNEVENLAVACVQCNERRGDSLDPPPGCVPLPKVALRMEEIRRGRS